MNGPQGAADLERAHKPSKLWRIAKRTALFLLGIAIALVVAILLIVNSQDGSITILQKFIYRGPGVEPNSFSPRHPPKDLVRSDGLRVRTDIRYDAQYPNSFLDIWYPSADQHVRRPTVIYLHGGGWFIGDKESGDPMAGGGKDKGAMSEPVVPFAKHGFNVVNLDYALTPDYRYPVQMRQLNEAIRFLGQHSAEYGLDMTNLVIAGGSAGAQMTAQYGLLLSDPAYAAQVEIRPAVDRFSVKALVIFSAPLKFSGFGWRMNAMLWPYLGTKDLVNSKQARENDIIPHVSALYPPTFITDGNQPDTFPENAKQMDRRLAREHVDHVFNYYEPSVARLGHTYTGLLNSKYGQDNLMKAITFMKEHTAPAGPEKRAQQRSGK